MSASLDAARKQVDAAHFKEALKSLWEVEKREREDVAAITAVNGLAAEIHRRADGRMRRDSAVLLARTDATLERFTGVRRPAERAAGPGELERSGRSRNRWPWLVVAVGIGMAKTEVVVELLDHRVGVIALLGVGLATAVVRFQLVGVALMAAALTAVTLGPGSAVLGVAIGFGAFVLLMGLFFAISTVLHLRQERDHDPPARPSSTQSP